MHSTQLSEPGHLDESMCMRVYIGVNVCVYEHIYEIEDDVKLGKAYCQRK